MINFQSIPGGISYSDARYNELITHEGLLHLAYLDTEDVSTICDYATFGMKRSTGDV